MYSLETMERFECFDTFNEQKGLVAISMELSSLYIAIPTLNSDGKARAVVQSYGDKATNRGFTWYSSDRKEIETSSDGLRAIALNF